MAVKQDLLIELATEELPPKSLQGLSDSFCHAITEQLQQLKLEFKAAEPFAAPRRIAVLIKQVTVKQADEMVEKRGPAIHTAFDAEGNPTKAALGWAKGMGIDVADAERLKTDKGEWLLHRAKVPGKKLDALIQPMLDHAIKQLPIPKTMRWGDTRHHFIRPVHGLVVLLGSEVLPAELFGEKAGRVVSGHRFHHPDKVVLEHAADYPQALPNAWVEPQFEKRKQRIIDQTNHLAQQLNATPVWDEALLNEVTALVEWPAALHASFEDKFLAVPKEALIYTMKDDQRYFPLVDKDGALLPHFIFIANIESKDPQQVIQGNEKVVRPRLADAQFFYNTDRKSSLASRLSRLGTVTFQQKLGSIGDKARRISQVSGAIATNINANHKIASRAGLLAKADLVSHMVMEFPEVQGTMGMYYARHDKEPAGVPEAIEAHYRPRFAGDALPSTPEGAAVAMADKLDTLVGIFGIGQIPKGDRDPFALRRSAIGLLRILVEQGYDLSLKDMLREALRAYDGILEFDEALVQQIFDFLQGRFRSWYQDQSYPVDVIQAVLATAPESAVQFDLKVKAVALFQKKPAAEALAAANKRIGNILAKADTIPDQVDISLLNEPAEQALHTALNDLKAEVADHYAHGRYGDALEQLAGLREPVDTFFDQVMVNADDSALKGNRLALLHALRQQFLQIADISLLQH